ERGLDPVGDEVEGRAALHRNRVARVVGEHEDRRVVGRVLAPPACPGLVPVATPGTEHVAAHDVGADALEELVGDLGVDAGPAARLAAASLPGAGSAAASTSMAHVTVPPSDGETLRRDVYLPFDPARPPPSVIDLEPYSRSMPTQYVHHDYAFVNIAVQASG